MPEQTFNEILSKKILDELELLKNDLIKERELKIQQNEQFTSLIASYNELKQKYEKLISSLCDECFHDNFQ